jgi:xanthine dehydrogenase YagR molybdenum-binding subunit
VQSVFALDSFIDELAEAIGMDPLEFREKNYATSGNGGTGNPYSSKGLDECYRRGSEAIGWHLNRKRDAGSDAGTYKRGVGMASQIWGGSGSPGPIVDVRIGTDGSVEVICGTQDIGTGTRTIMAQVAAEELGLEFEDITVKIGDSNYPYATGSGGSQTAPSVCPAVRAACAEAKGKLLAAAASQLSAPAEQLEVGVREIHVKGDAAKTITFKDLCSRMGAPVEAKGIRAPNPSGYTLNSFGAHFAEVEVDTKTGRVRVLKMVAAHEFGRVINPMTAANQIYGGVIQGMGYALTEQRVMDPETGLMANRNLLDYKPITANAVPEIEAIMIDNVDPVINNLGMKGLGEPPRIPAAGAIANAIYNACGARVRSLPITPEKVLTALNERKEG